MAEQVIDQNQRHHSFGHGYGTWSDAGIMPSFDPNLGFFAFMGDRVLLAVDGRRGFDHHTYHNIVAIRNTAEDAAGVIGFRGDFFVFGDEDVVAFRPFGCSG